MAKVIKINENIVMIGTDAGSIKEVRLEDLNFTPTVGDEVEVFETETSVVVTKKEQPVKENPTSGININVSNNQNTQGEAVYVANNTKAVNKVVYCLLAFFLGGIGVHKFYAGKTGSGILYLLFSWTAIPGIIAFVEFIVALCQKADANGNILA